jgi:hypothetical protein
LFESTETELEKFVKSNQVNLFSAHLSHLEPLCAAGEAVSLKVSQCYLLAKCLSEGKWNWPFIYYVPNHWVGRFRKWNVLLTNIHKSSLHIKGRGATATKTSKARALPKFWATVNPISTREADYAHHSTMGLVWLKFAVAPLLDGYIIPNFYL